jgi:hypothetical protein
MECLRILTIMKTKASSVRLSEGRGKVSSLFNVNLDDRLVRINVSGRGWEPSSMRACEIAQFEIQDDPPSTIDVSLSFSERFQHGSHDHSIKKGQEPAVHLRAERCRKAGRRAKPICETTLGLRRFMCRR